MGRLRGIFHFATIFDATEGAFGERRRVRRWWSGWVCGWAWAVSAAGQAMLPTSHSGPWSNNAYLPAGWTGTELTEYAVNYDGAGSGAAKFDSTNDALEIEFA